MITIIYKIDFTLCNKHSCKSEALTIYSSTFIWMQKGSKLYNRIRQPQFAASVTCSHVLEAG